MLYMQFQHETRTLGEGGVDGEGAVHLHGHQGADGEA